MNPTFSQNYENGSKDLILFLIETMHNEFNKSLSKSYNNLIYRNEIDYECAFNSFLIFYKNNYRTLISDLFYGISYLQIKCLKCKNITHKFKCYPILIFPLEEVRKFKNNAEKNINIMECFEYCQKRVYMENNNQIYCQNCQSMENYLQISYIFTSPKVLIINLQRGIGFQTDIKFEFKEYLDIKKFNYYKNNDFPSYYELIGIITLIGSSKNEGKYISFCKSFTDLNWYKYNDSQIDKSSFDEAKSTGVPSILFYSFIQR